jgi:cell division protein FtsB
MRRIATAVAVAALAITLIVTSLLPAGATHTEAHLRRQITQLENQIDTLQRQMNTLKGDVRDLNYNVFRCMWFDDSLPHTIDSATTYPLYYDSVCT